MSRDLFSLSLNVKLPDTGAWPRLVRALLPHPGNTLFTLLVVAGLLLAQSAGAFPSGRPQGAAATSTGTLAYQGRLANASGAPITDTVNMIFRLYNAATGGTPLWTEQWTGSNGVKVSDGLFNVMLGSLTQIPQSVVMGNNTLWLGITVGTDDEMTPRVQLGSVPFAVQALTVPDGSVTTAKLADGAVTAAKLNIDNSVSVYGTLGIRGNGDLYFHRDDGFTTASIVLDGPGAGTDKLEIQKTGGGTIQQFAVDANVTAFRTGNVGIGTTNPGAKLDVKGNIRLSQNSNDKIDFGWGTEIWRRSSDGVLVLDSQNDTIEINGNVGIRTYPQYTLDVAGAAHASSFPTSSDTRLKKNVTPLTDVLEKLVKVQGVAFDWNDKYQAMGRSTGHREIGVIAQEAEAVFPELVTSWGDEGYKAVDYGRLTGVLIEAIKEQQQQIATLEARIATLEQTKR